MTVRRRGQLLALVVEDDEAVASVIADTLASGGFLVKIARDGAEAVRVAQATPPRVVLLDLSLPEMSGHSVLHELRESEVTRLVPVVVVTGFPDLLPSQDQALIQGLVKKPFDVQTLIQVTRQAARSRPGATVSTPPVPPGEV